MDTRTDHPTNRKRTLEDIRTAQASAGVDTSDATSPLDEVAAKLRAKVHRQSKAVWDAAYQAEPGKATLRLCQAILATQAFDVARITRELELATDPETKEGILALLQMVKSNGRSLKALTDGLTKLAKIHAEIDLDTLPNVIEFVGVNALRSQLCGTDE